MQEMDNMIFIVFSLVLFQSKGLWVSNLSSNSLPWNTSITGATPSAFFNMVSRNIPWFWPLITLFLFAMFNYVYASRKIQNWIIEAFIVSVIFIISIALEVIGLKVPIQSAGLVGLIGLIGLITIFVTSLFNKSDS